MSPVCRIPKSTPYKAFSNKGCYLYCVVVTLNLHLQSKNDVLTVSEKNYYLWKENHGMEKAFKNRCVGIFLLYEFVFLKY